MSIKNYHKHTLSPRNSDNLRTDGLAIGRGKIQNTGVRIQESEEMRITECGMKKTGIKV